MVVCGGGGGSGVCGEGGMVVCGGGGSGSGSSVCGEGENGDGGGGGVWTIIHTLSLQYRLIDPEAVDLSCCSSILWYPDYHLRFLYKHF